MFKKVSDLKTEYLLLERAASTRSPEWLVHYGKIDRWWTRHSVRAPV